MQTIESNVLARITYLHIADKEIDLEHFIDEKELKLYFTQLDDVRDISCVKNYEMIHVFEKDKEFFAVELSDFDTDKVFAFDDEDDAKEFVENYIDDFNERNAM